jgi:hypothetical protein
MKEFFATKIEYKNSFTLFSLKIDFFKKIQ